MNSIETGWPRTGRRSSPRLKFLVQLGRIETIPGLDEDREKIAET